ncbi:MAG: hypothetical protein ACM30D_18200 [Hyphomicrobiales bacterium]|nr:hypothetical protein [Xanthobacteraceae bacterium]
MYFNSAATARQKGYRVMAHGAARMSPRWQTFGFVTGAGEVGSSTGRLKSAFNDVDVNVPATLKRRQPLAFGSSELKPPRRPGD